MTRINAGIPVKELHDKHLMAEHREIKRIPNTIKSGKARLSGIPKKFTLGTGHVKFFYDKLKYLHDRYQEIYLECKRRGFNVSSFHDAFEDLPKELYNDWKPSKEDVELIQDRINERLQSMNI